MQNRRSNHLLTSTLIALSLGLLTIAMRADDRPNVVFILTDDQRADALSCMGHPHLKTPHIDRLAEEGALFKNHFCTTSLCSPSRASILGGLYAHTHGVTNNFTDYPRDLPTFPRTLQGEGYATAYIGKWHMGEDDDSVRPGFDHFVTHRGQGKYFDTEFRANNGDREVVPGYYTTVVTDMSIDWMESLEDKEQPFLLMLGHKAPHSFYYPEEKYETAFDHVRFPYPESAFELEDNPEWITKRLTTWHGIYGPLFDWRKEFPDDSAAAMLDFENMVRAYLGTILSVDDSVGRIYEYLEKSGELDNTLFIFTSDNGILEGEHGMVDKRTAHEGSLRIPLVVRFPELIDEGEVIDAQTLTLDFASSILEICEAPPLPKTQGQSWKKLVSEGDPDWRSSWYYEYNYESQFPYTPNVRALRTDTWKYIRYPHGDGSPDKHMAELYNVVQDPEERNNLIDDPEHADLVKELRAELDRRIAEARPDGKDEMPMDEGIKSGLPDKDIR
ncbi:MAG: sulfatase [Verrucomicrobiota bacterium]